MNSLVSADYGSSSDSTDDENATQTTNFGSNHVKNFLQSASDSENDSNDDEDSNSSTERSKLKYKHLNLDFVLKLIHGVDT